MDGTRFDAFARRLGRGRTRRGLFRLVGPITLGGLFIPGALPTGAKKHGKGKGKKKVEICHNGQTIKVSKSALKGHLKHGDTVGACSPPPGPPPPPVPPPPPGPPTCPDDRPVCGNGACCSPDKECTAAGGGGFSCTCLVGKTECDSGFCSNDCPSQQPPDLGTCSCAAGCLDLRLPCQPSGECCPPTQVCLAGGCGCPAGKIECQPGFCDSAVCPNGQPRNLTTCVCPG